MTSEQVVLITGASSGIGYATSLAFARRGWMVVGTARREERLYQLKQTIETETSGVFLPLVTDVQDVDAMKQVVGAIQGQFGRLDVLVANAGVGQRGSVVDSDWADLQTLLRTNIDGVLHSVRAAVPLMRQGERGGHIVIVSSISYQLVMPYAANYAASKAFVSSLARSLRLELEADNIGVSDMIIGRTETEFSEKRLGQAGRSGAEFQ